MDLFESSYSDSREGALTPEGVEFVLYPAGPLIRSIAYGIDLLVQWVIIIVLIIATSALQDAFGIWLYFILIFCVDWFYHVICELSFHGQSLGKRIMGIRVIRANGSPVDPASSFLRNLLRFADTFFFLCHIALVAMITSPGYRRLGDWAGNTLVVYTPKSLTIHRRLAADWLSNREPIIPPRPLLHDEKQALLMFARRYPLLGEARANEIAGVYAGNLRRDASEENAGTGEAAGTGSLSDAGYLLGIARKLSGGGAPANAVKGKNP